MDEVYFAEEALRFEQLEEAEISDLEGAFVQVQHRSLLGLRSAMSSCCSAHAGGAEPVLGDATPWRGAGTGMGAGNVVRQDVPISEPETAAVAVHQGGDAFTLKCWH